MTDLSGLLTQMEANRTARARYEAVVATTGNTSYALQEAYQAVLDRYPNVGKRSRLFAIIKMQAREAQEALTR